MQSLHPKMPERYRCYYFCKQGRPEYGSYLSKVMKISVKMLQQYGQLFGFYQICS